MIQPPTRLRGCRYQLAAELCGGLQGVLAKQ